MSNTRFPIRIFHKLSIGFASASLGFGLHLPLYAASNTTDLKSFSLDDLANMEVSIVSKRPQRLTDSAAAVTVITADSIRRSGYTTLPEILRLAPGMNVARADAGEWAISARGFNNHFANKMLVMVDGRSVYTPLFSGVFWENMGLVLEDIEKIEIVRGPGATSWGANAVNGVVNIITKHSVDTQGGLVSAFASDEQNGFSARIGEQLSNLGWFRLYVKKFHKNSDRLVSGEADDDTLDDERVGFRADLDLPNNSNLTVDGEYFKTDGHNPLITGGHLLFDWYIPNRFSGKDNFRLNYENQHLATVKYTGLMERLTTLDVEYQSEIDNIKDHNLVLGVGYQRQQSYIPDKTDVIATSKRKNLNKFNSFIQDEITLIPDKWYITLGSKFEHNSYTGWEIQPSLRSRWQLNSSTTLWGAVSRAVRTPSRAERDLLLLQKSPYQVPGPVVMPVYYALMPSSEFDSEKLLAYELGTRWNPRPDFSADIALFYNDYNELRSLEIQPIQYDPGTSLFIIQGMADNKVWGNLYGLEVSADWRFHNSWRLRTNYSLLEMNLQADPTSTDVLYNDIAHQSPKDQFLVWLSGNLNYNIELDLIGRHIGALTGLDVDPYTELDLRLGWHITPDFTLSLTGRNLLHRSHDEYGWEVTGEKPHQIEREFILTAELRF